MRAILALAVGLAGCTDYDLTQKGDDPDGGEDADCPVDPLAPYAGSIDGTCASEVLVGAFDPIVEWAWTENAAYPGYAQVMSTPAVGDVTGDGLPDIVFTAFTGILWNEPGVLVVLSGHGDVELEIAASGGYLFQGSAPVALGDLEGDGRAEICVASSTAAVVCLEGDGTFRWAAGAELSHFGAPAIADLDGDGRAEVILGRQIFDASGALVGIGAGGSGSQSAFWDGTDTMMSFAADLDGDGQQEVIAGGSVYRRDGSLVWTDGGTDGFDAVADFDGDGSPEVVKVYGGTVTLVDAAGSLRWSVYPGFGGNGGTPTIADFDGDGAPEIGIAGASYYMVLEGDGSTRWSVPVTDASSHMTGSSVFDFEGDGAAEVVYADEYDAWVFDGSTGTVEMDLSDHASATAFEYPVLADVDLDGSAEIVLASNNGLYAGWNGVRVIGDAASSWRAARPVWNQHAWSITNVEDDLTIPAQPVPNWTTYNNFRSGDLATGEGSALPNLVAEIAQVCEVDCDEGRLVVWVSPGNLGAATAEAGATVALYGTLAGVEALLGVESVATALPPGQYGASLVFDLQVGAPVDSLRSEIRPAGPECDATDDVDVLDGPWCEE